MKRTWDRVFAGTGVVPLFCTGNHDFDGWWYGDMAVEMHANGYSEGEALCNLKKEPGERLGDGWKEVFGEPFDWIRCRKSPPLVSGTMCGKPGLGKVMRA